jgi:hypothetical protein
LSYGRATHHLLPAAGRPSSLARLLFDSKFLPELNCSIQVDPVKRETLSLALNETTHALRYVESAGRRFRVGMDELETGSKIAITFMYIDNRLTDAQASLVAAVEEIGRLLNES